VRRNGASRRAAAAQRAFHASGLRNIKFTGPYFHTGSKKNLAELVQFYDSIKHFETLNFHNLDAGLRIFDLGAQDETALIEFMETGLTDWRAAFEEDKFDHPQLCVPNGHDPVTGQTVLVDIPAVGSTGAADRLLTFEEVLNGGPGPRHGGTLWDGVDLVWWPLHHRRAAGTNPVGRDRTNGLEIPSTARSAGSLAIDRSEFEQKTKDPTDLEGHLRADLPKTSDHPPLGNRLEVLTLRITHRIQARFCWIDLDVRREVPMGGRTRNDHDHSGRTLVERISRNHHGRATARLFPSNRLPEVNQPDLASPRRHQDQSLAAPCSTARSVSISAHAVASCRSASNRSFIWSKKRRRSSASAASSNSCVIGRPVESASLANRSLVLSLTLIVVLIG
jgi:hypothetical protein